MKSIPPLAFQTSQTVCKNICLPFYYQTLVTYFKWGNSPFQNWLHEWQSLSVLMAVVATTWYFQLSVHLEQSNKTFYPDSRYSTGYFIIRFYINLINIYCKNHFHLMHYVTKNDNLVKTHIYERRNTLQFQTF